MLLSDLPRKYRLPRALDRRNEKKNHCARACYGGVVHFCQLQRALDEKWATHPAEKLEKLRNEHNYLIAVEWSKRRVGLPEDTLVQLNSDALQEHHGHNDVRDRQQGK